MKLIEFVSIRGAIRKRSIQKRSIDDLIILGRRTRAMITGRSTPGGDRCTRAIVMDSGRGCGLRATVPDGSRDRVMRAVVLRGGRDDLHIIERIFKVRTRSWRPCEAIIRVVVIRWDGDLRKNRHSALTR